MCTLPNVSAVSSLLESSRISLLPRLKKIISNSDAPHRQDALWIITLNCVWDRNAMSSSKFIRSIWVVTAHWILFPVGIYCCLYHQSLEIILISPHHELSATWEAYSGTSFRHSDMSWVNQNPISNKSVRIISVTNGIRGALLLFSLQTYLLVLM